MSQIYKYGWLPDTPDHRDLRYCSPPQLKVTLPAEVDLRESCPPIYNQLSIGSCTGNAIAGALQYDSIKRNQADKDIIPSRLFIYYNERVMENSVYSDSGAMIRDGIKSVAAQGACDEKLWPYDIDQFAVKPPDSCYQNALQYRALRYYRVNQDLNDMKTCIAEGYPFICGITVYESLESEGVAKTGMIPYPGESERCSGGHAVCMAGYSDQKQCFLMRNSWGTSWGISGYAWIPYKYLSNDDLCADLWTIRQTM